MKLIFDATPLIYLCKVRVLEKLTQLRITNIIPLSVYKEVVEKGKENEEASYIQKLVDEKVFEIAKVNDKIESLSYNPLLDEADVDVLSLAKQQNCIAIMDEKAGRSSAAIEHIKHAGSIFILFKLLKSKIISKTELRKILDKMIEEGWFCSTDLYAYILSRL